MGFSNIKINQFEGPLSLLLKIIEKEEMDITEVSLAGIADQYVGYIKNSGCINPDETADFLVVAAKLLLIKSKALLPYLYPEEDEEIDEFANQLKMYKEFIDATKKIEKIINKKKFMFAREFNRKAILANLSLFSPPPKLVKEDLKMIFSDILEKVRPIEEEKLGEKKIEKKVTIEEKIFYIQKKILERIKFNFSRLFGQGKSKTEVIVSFLAMLELVKQKDIIVSQNGLFEEMEIRKIE